MTATERDTGTDRPGQPAGERPVLMKIVLFLVGLLLMVLAAANLMNLSEWAQRWGQIPVFLLFFLFMAIAGRWFWSGADALIAAVRGKNDWS